MSIIVDGTMAPYLWTGRQYVLGDVMGPGIFGDGSLTGDALHIVWSQGNGISADLTINGVTITFEPAQGFYAAYSVMGPTYQNITAGFISDALSGSLNSYSPEDAAKYNPFGLGGSIHISGAQTFDGYFFVTSMVDNSVVPVSGPVAGDVSLLIAMVILFTVWRRLSGSKHGPV